MKKISTLFVALSLVLGLYAAPTFSKSDFTPTKDLVVSTKAFTSAPSQKVAPAQARLAQAPARPIVAEGEYTQVAVAPAATDTMWIVDYRYYFNVSSYGVNYWIYDFEDANSSVQFEFQNFSSELHHFADNLDFESGYCRIINGTDTVKAAQNSYWNITWVSQDEESFEHGPIYTYHFNGVLSDSVHKVDYTLDFDVQLINLYLYKYSDGNWYFFYYGTNYPLLDKPSDPIVENITVNIPQDSITVVDYTAQDGTIDYSFVSEDADYTVYVAILTDNQIGTFYNDDFDHKYVSLQVGDSRLTLDSVNAVVAATDEEGVYSFNIKFFPRYGGMSYEFIGLAGAPEEPVNTAFQYDSENDIEYTFGADAEIYINSDYIEEQYIYVSIADAGAGFAAYFNIAALDENSTIPVGTYIINNTWNMGTCDASSGYDSENQRNTPMYFATIDPATNYLAEIWYIVSGTVTVSYENNALTIVVNGVNSKGAVVTVTYTQASTGIEEVVANTKAGQVRKVVDNGQVFVVRDNKVFNILGSRVNKGV